MFLLYLPAILIDLLFMKPGAEQLWKTNHMHVIFVMDVVCMCGLGGNSRTEDRIARELDGSIEA